MKISGIIVEYNPLHNGHLFHINKTKELTNSDLIIAVMSGNFNQRGIPSVVDKWKKTSMALNNGVDIVLELPAIYSLSSAEFFSNGSISLLNSLGIVDSICFGSEAGDVNFLKEVSHLLVEEPPLFKSLLKEELDEGLPFPKARSSALIHYLEGKNYYNEKDLVDNLSSSNNILGIEYLKSLKKLHSNIVPYTIKREGGAYNSTNLNNIFSSATSIRKILKSNALIEELVSHVPPSVYENIVELKNLNYNFPFDYMMFPYIKYKAMTSKENYFELIPDSSEGLHNKILTTLKDAKDYEHCIEMIKSKRYTYTRISRILCQYFLGFYEYNTIEMRKAPCPYARILGFTKNGATALKSMKSNSSIPIYSKLPKDISPTLSLDLQCTSGYSILNPSISAKEDYLQSPIIL
ncbi:nucleotidyltransferase [Clostridium subterminale]|uniref:tRNA(Met) cytidine acetate ligase n=1 Tax=Clostridium subterminale TaxID=1550 RepID=A0ABP3VV48_CLOSU